MPFIGSKRTLSTSSRDRYFSVSLEQPELPLHNDASGLAARLQARARDISLHTKSAKSTKIKDSLMTISQTAKSWGKHLRIYFG
jgi:hypothetical protein